MFGSETLEVAVGLIFLFLILSLLLTAAREVLEGLLQTRAIHLERGIRELLSDRDGTELAKKIYEHPLVSSLYRGTYNETKLKNYIFNFKFLGKDDWQRQPFRSNLPAYVPTRNFALALLDLAGRGDPQKGAADLTELNVELIRSSLSHEIADLKVKRAILIAIDDAKGDLNQAIANLENWFDSGMDRVAGWYRKETQWVLLSLGLFVAVLLNIDAIRVASYLYENGAVRAVILSEAEAFVQRAGDLGNAGSDADGKAILQALGCARELKATPAVDSAATMSCAQRRIAALGYPIGWYSNPNVPPDQGSGFTWTSIPGWLLTALAISLGSPFWFDILNKFMVIRSTVKPHEKSPEEASEDRQSDRGQTPPRQSFSDNERPSATPTISPQPNANVHQFSGPEEHSDCCLSDVDLADEEITRDQDLPVTVGGVAERN
jgi:hypothetical protein